jgi:hypothetical protein
VPCLDSKDHLESNMGKMKGDLLNSWKEIAQFLRKDVKTCQRWEKDRGLPIHRLDGSVKSRVFAYPEELTAWLQKNDIVSAGNGARSQSPKKPVRIRQIVMGLLALAALLAVLHFGFFAPRSSKADSGPVSPESNPANFRIVGSTLIVVNSAGAELWQFDTGIDKLASEEAYRDVVLEAEKNFRLAFPHIIIRDINHDGWAEVVFSIQTTDDFDEGVLYGFNRKGRQLWPKIKVGERHRFGNVVFANNYRIDGMAATDLNGDGNLELVLMTAHMQEWPSQLLIIDVHGKTIGEYWNSGRFTYMAFADINGNGIKEILAGGTNNEYGKACLIVLDPRKMDGCSPQLKDEYKCLDFKKGTELAYLLFPRTDVDQAVVPSRDCMDRIDLPENRVIRVMPETAHIIYELGYDLRVNLATTSTSFEILHARLHGEGKIHSSLNAEYFERLKNGALYWNGQAWISQPSFSHQ